MDTENKDKKNIDVKADDSNVKKPSTKPIRENSSNNTKSEKKSFVRTFNKRPEKDRNIKSEGIDNSKTKKEEAKQQGSDKESTKPRNNRKASYNRNNKRHYKPRKKYSAVPESIANNNLKLKDYSSNLHVMPLGGLNEIGKNSAIIQYKDEIVVVDMGLAFPDETMPGVEIVIPNYNYLYKNIDKVKGILITHGHEDHIGSLAYFFKASTKKNIPIYASDFTTKLINHKLQDKFRNKKFNLNSVSPRDRIRLSPNIEVEFIRITHSIPDAFVIAIHTPEGTIVHTGDYKFDLTPVDRQYADFFKLAQLGERGTLLLLSDSTNANKEGFTPSEMQVVHSYRDALHKAKGRVIVSVFSSHAHRAQELIKIGNEFGRKTALDGRSIHKCFDIGQEVDTVKVPEGSVIDISEASGLTPEKVQIVCTGTQGEEMSALSRAARGEHRNIKIEEGDTVIMSANKIPGNEVGINRVVNLLIKKGAKVYLHGTHGLHVSGHGCRGDIALMLNLIKPKFFMPVHGEYMHLNGSKNLAVDFGMHPDDVILTSIGDKIAVSSRFIKKVGSIESGNVLIDSKNPRGIANQTIVDRNTMASDGLIIVHVLVNVRSRKISGMPEIISRGVGSGFNPRDISKEIVLNYSDTKVDNIADFKKNIKDFVKKKIRMYVAKNPVIIPLIANV